MASVSLNSKVYEIAEDETVLEGLLRNKVDLRYGCKAGLCQSCVLRVVDGEVPLAAQNGLNDSQKELGFFLACQCRPNQDIGISLIDQASSIYSAKVLEKYWLNAFVLCLRLQVNINFRAGQFVTLWRPGNVGRSYSIASLPSEGVIECHIKVLKNGAFSAWAKDSLQVDDDIDLQGPMGECFYQADIEQSMLLLAIGTGLSPVLGVLRDALASGHRGAIDLVLGSKNIESFYLMEPLQALAKEYKNLTLHFICLAQSTDLIRQDDIYSFTKAYFPDLSGYKVFVCGAFSFVQKMKKQCFMARASMNDIHSDAFGSAEK